MNCPNCHGKSKVINAHYLPKRRRECLTCKARWTTVEVARDEWDRLQRVWKLAIGVALPKGEWRVEK